METQKGKRWRTSGEELVPKGGSREVGRAPVHWEAPSQGALGGAVESQKAGQSRGLEDRKQRKVHFSAHKQLVYGGPDQMAYSGETREKPTEILWLRWQAWVAKRGMAYKPLQCT